MKSNLLLKILVAIIFVLAAVGMVMVFNAGDETPDELAKLNTATDFVVNLSVVLLIV